MFELLVIVGTLLVGMPALLSMLRAVADDGYGRRPAPRSHRDEEELTQHEHLRRLVR